MTPELTKLLAEAKAYVDNMTPDQRAEMYRRQRENAVRNCAVYEPETSVVVAPTPAHAMRIAVGMPNYDQIAHVVGVDRGTVKKVILASLYSASPLEAAPEALEPDYRHILLSLCAGLYLCEGRSDIGEEVRRALKLVSVFPPDEIDNDSDLADWLSIEHDAESIWLLKAPSELG